MKAAQLRVSGVSKTQLQIAQTRSNDNININTNMNIDDTKKTRSRSDDDKGVIVDKSASKDVSKSGSSVNFKATVVANIAELKQLADIYRTTLIGICSIATTLITFVLYFVNGNYWSFLYFVDLMINGYLMLIVLKFGAWLCPKCCRKMITTKSMQIAIANG